MRRARRATTALAATLVALLPSAARAQRSPGVMLTATAGPSLEWLRFGDGVAQQGLPGSDSVVVRSVRQWSVPVAVVYPVSDRLTVDLAGTYTSGKVTLRSPDPVTGRSTYDLSGMSDLRVRATAHLVGDNVLLTLGASLPTGTTTLDREELSALRVLAAPALGLQPPGIGLGAGGTAGLVLARQLGGWAWALGGSYEVRGTYNPIAAFSAGVPAADFDPGDAVHLSIGTEGLLGAHAMTLTFTADLFSGDELRQGDAPSGATPIAAVKLGPVLSADWRLRLGTTRFREFTLYAVDRYRSSYEADGASVDGSSGNYLDAGLRAVRPVGGRTDLLIGLQLRHQTGLDVDRTLSTAAARSAGLMLGLSHSVGGLMLQPWVRGQAGQIDAGAGSVTMTGASGGLAVGLRF